MPDLPEQMHSRPGTAVATQGGAAVEVGYSTNNDEGLTAADILMPRIKIVQKMSRVMDDGLADYGAVYMLTSPDDMEPEILAAPAAKGELGDGVRFYVHGDPLKRWSWTRPDRSLGKGHDFPRLEWVEGGDPRKVNRTYMYYLTIPATPVMPVTFLMYGAWGGNSAKYINTQLVLARQKGIEVQSLAFKLQTRKTERNGNPFVQAIVALDKISAKDKKADMEIVERHHELLGAGNIQTLDDNDTVEGSAEVVTDAPDLG